MTENNLVNIYKNPWGGWTAAVCGIISGDFHSKEEAEAWAAKKVTEFLALMEEYRGDIP